MFCQFHFKIQILVNLAYDPRDLVFDGNLTTHRKIIDGRATINFNGTFYVDALRMPASN